MRGAGDVVPDEAVDAEDDEHVGGQDEPTGADHHQNLAGGVAGVPLNSCAPDRLHGKGDEAGDGVCQGEVVHQVVHVGACPAQSLQSTTKQFQKYFVLNYLYSEFKKWFP